MSVRSKGGKLFLDFSFRGVRCREHTGLRDSPDNRRDLARRWAVIRAQIRHGSFDYQSWFPEGLRLGDFYPHLRVRRECSTFGDYLARWHAQRSPFDATGALLPGADIHPTTWLGERSKVRALASRLGHVALADLTRAHLLDFRRELVESGKAAKTITNIMGVGHKALADAVDTQLIAANPSPRLTRRLGRATTHQPTPLSVDELRAFFSCLPAFALRLRDGRTVDAECLRDLYLFWSRTGWRSNEVVALRFDDVSVAGMTIDVRVGRSPRCGGLEAAPKTGRRQVDMRYAPGLVEIVERRRVASLAAGAREYVFCDSAGRALSQEWLAKRVWRPTLRVAGISSRGQYSLRDTFITLAISAGEDPGWVAQVCGTSEAMIFGHYRRWLPGRDAGGKMGAVLAGVVSPVRGVRE